MRVVHLTRKPLGESSVAANVLKYGTGSIAIDATRIGKSGATRRDGRATEPNEAGWSNMRGHGIATIDAGRWPANMILEHRPGCVPDGTRRVKTGVAVNRNRDPIKGSWYGTREVQTGDDQTYADPDGTEEMAAWRCEAACPVLDVDGQSGVQQSKPMGGKGQYSGGSFGGGRTDGLYHGDIGGASRFYKQVQSLRGDEGEAMERTHGVPQDLLDYLYTMITPTHIGGRTLVALDLQAIDWSEYGDAEFHGAIVMGDPSSYVDELWRVLKPGAHIMAISPEDEPTGHTGACALEDKGFEIRDAILWVNEPGRLHYVPKPSPRERHAGCEHLKLKKRAEEAIEDPDLEGDDLLDAVDEADMEAEENGIDLDDPNLYKGNVHPTVKPKEMLKRLLGDVPKGAVVLDPFMGSGSQGLACMETGHDYIGIEKEQDYIEIADARVRYWDRAKVGDGATIESEAPKVEESRDEMDLDDFFDL